MSARAARTTDRRSPPRLLDYVSERDLDRLADALVEFMRAGLSAEAPSAPSTDDPIHDERRRPH